MLVLAGVLYRLVQTLGLGRLPGDIAIEGDTDRVYIPLGTARAIGLVPTLAFRLLDRRAAATPARRSWRRPRSRR